MEDRRDLAGSAGPDRFRVEVTSETALWGRLCYHPRAQIVCPEPLSSVKHFYNQNLAKGKLEVKELPKISVGFLGEDLTFSWSPLPLGSYFYMLPVSHCIESDVNTFLLTLHATPEIATCDWVLSLPIFFPNTKTPNFIMIYTLLSFYFVD